MREAIANIIALNIGDFKYGEIADKILDLFICEKNEISLCPHCYCMTKNICGKCKKIKEER